MEIDLSPHILSPFFFCLIRPACRRSVYRPSCYLSFLPLPPLEARRLGTEGHFFFLFPSSAGQKKRRPRRPSFSSSSPFFHQDESRAAPSPPFPLPLLLQDGIEARGTFFFLSPLSFLPPPPPVEGTQTERKWVSCSVSPFFPEALPYGRLLLPFTLLLSSSDRDSSRTEGELGIPSLPSLSTSWQDSSVPYSSLPLPFLFPWKRQRLKTVGIPILSTFFPRRLCRSWHTSPLPLPSFL